MSNLPYSTYHAQLLEGHHWVKDSGTWKGVNRIYTKSGGSWVRVNQHYVKSGGSWVEVHEGNKWRAHFNLNNNNDGGGQTNFAANWVDYPSNDALQTATGNTQSGDSWTFNLSSALVQRGWNSSTAVKAVVELNSWQRHVRIESLPAGSRVVLWVKGGRRILGKGGNGANGTTGSNTNGGQNGQTALYCRTQTFMINDGQIGGGGGGGGGGRGGQCTYQNTGQYGCMKGSQCQATYQNFSTSQGGGGGGGIGYPGGSGGSGGNNGQSGQVNGAGNGGNDSGCGSVSGGNGGNWGSNAQGGSGRGTPGSAGNAIDGNSYIQRIVSGAINGPQLN